MGTNFAGINLPTASTITPMTQKLSERVRWVLDNVDISESAWSEGAEMSRGYIQKLKNRDAKRPDRDALERLADVAGVPRLWFVKGEGPEPVPTKTKAAPASRPSAPELRTELDAVPAPTTGRTTLSDALGQVFSPTRHKTTDIRAVEDAMGPAREWRDGDGDHLAAAARLLDAAASMRATGEPVTAASLAARLAFGSGALAQEAQAKRHREFQDDVAAHVTTHDQNADDKPDPEEVEAFHASAKRNAARSRSED